ncbi:MAG TPA: hypothetical protein VK509_13465, partial [Polyangiales bacterium]|nr:hypothetical protein [Polyangiales bacterium]
MNGQTPLRCAGARALSLSAAALVHVALALLLPRASQPLIDRSWSALQLIEIAPPPPQAPPIRARSERAVPSSAAPTPRPAAPSPPRREPPVAALPLDPAPDAPADFATALASAEPATTDRQGPLPVHSARSQSRSRPLERAQSASPGLDRSRNLTLAGGLDWRCAFPAQADDADVDRGTATLRIAADAQGRVREVSVLSDSGHGFGRAARNCAFSKTFV